MANTPAPALELRDGDADELDQLLRSTTVPAGLARRARIVMLAADGMANTRISEVVGVSVPTVLKWRSRYLQDGLDGLLDAQRPGRPRHVDHADVVSATLMPPPKKYGVTHWSSRLLAGHLGIGNATVARAWREYGVQPWRSGTFKFSTDPQLVAKVTDVVGLYLEPPENAIVLCVDEKSQIQALDRTAPMLPMQPGQIERRTHDYKRHGTTTLFAALEIATGQVTAAVKPRHRHQEFLAFLRQIDRAYPDQELHLVMDNYATHKTPEVKDWLARHKNFHVHFTPTSASWLNLVEVWFGIIDRQAIRRGIFTSVKDLNAKIRAFINGWNDRKHPFVWTKTAEDILKKSQPKTN
ncbi:IS630 family transposase [Nocardia farcinica]|uniref:IS630 family transposase n=1 Tax=Mycobacteriales TaxID=85007 RepID=UPI0018949DA1|nr:MULTISPECIES: IS630 family transposase [Mycobacteriales]MBF6070150.1 IS630 family transposase [Nocardia farcinica]MBF6216444.1 IS630 family transposase [Nocardia puris]MBF6423017.1 IS630 family transposase [Nocardia farcinica]MBF6434721.1 IS630 family transposase [Nocardia farcinica]MBF6505828.1 IS630 family transposase [Nocardia farcinica]